MRPPVSRVLSMWENTGACLTYKLFMMSKQSNIFLSWLSVVCVLGQAAWKTYWSCRTFSFSCFFQFKTRGNDATISKFRLCLFLFDFYQELRQLFWGGTTFKQCVIVLGLLTNILNLPFAIMPEWKVQISNNLADFRWLVLAEEAALRLFFIFLFFSRLKLPQVPASCVHLWISIINHSLQADGICKTDKLMSAFKMDIPECGSARARQSQRDK